MKKAVIEATENFCSTILSASLEEGDIRGKSFYGAAISLYENETEHTWCLLFKRDTLNEIAQNLLCEDNLCEDDLDDLLKEISNQIVGSAKVILQQKYPYTEYKLSVPEFMGHVCEPFPFQLQEMLCYQVKEKTFIVGRQ